MVSLLKQISLAIGLMASDDPSVALKEGWQGYVWKVHAVGPCLAGAEERCMLAVGRWDWKRDQRYTVRSTHAKAKNRLTTQFELDNRDPDDDDNVCMAVIYYDKAGREVGVAFDVIHALAARNTRAQITIQPVRPVRDIARVAIGSKQCDPDYGPDVALFERVKAALNQK